MTRGVGGEAAARQRGARGMERGRVDGEEDDVVLVALELGKVDMVRAVVADTAG